MCLCYVWFCVWPRVSPGARGIAVKCVTVEKTDFSFWSPGIYLPPHEFCSRGHGIGDMLEIPASNVWSKVLSKLNWAFVSTGQRLNISVSKKQAAEIKAGRIIRAEPATLTSTNERFGKHWLGISDQCWTRTEGMKWNEGFLADLVYHNHVPAQWATILRFASITGKFKQPQGQRVDSTFVFFRNVVTI